MSTTFRLGLATAGVAAALAATLSGAGISTAAAEPTSYSSENAATPTRVETQRGLVLEGTGSVDGLAVTVYVYENSTYGNSLQVVLGDPEEDRIGFLEQAAPFVVDGALDVVVDVAGTPVRLTGTVTPTDQTKVVEPIQDGGEQLVTRGTHTQLATAIVATIGEASGDLAFAPAFAFDLEVRRVALYGG